MRLCLYAVSSIWKRDILRLRRQKSRLLGLLFAPFFWYYLFESLRTDHE